MQGERNMSELNRFGETVSSSEETLNGHSKADVMSFIENNNGRYYEIFKRNENRKFFLNMNWAAFFLSCYWIFYRKMYKAGVIFIVVSGILGSISALCAITVFKEDELLSIQEAYYEFDSEYIGQISSVQIEANSESALKLSALDRQLRRLQSNLLFGEYCRC